MHTKEEKLAAFSRLLDVQDRLRLPRAMPWARSFCPFRACGASLPSLFLPFQGVLKPLAKDQFHNF